MPHRIGFCWDRMVSLENCIAAEKTLAKNKKDNKMAQHIGQNAEKYGKDLFEKLSAGEIVFHANKETTISDSYKGKERHLKIPCLEDQAVQIAWLNIATPEIERRNYHYNCGSIPGAGQSRAVEALKKWLKDKKNKYGATMDIRRFYETCPHWVVMKGLNRIFKDKQFLYVAVLILANMSDTGVGLAIGHPSSHWFANVAIMEIDHELKRRHPDVKFTRYMDNFGIVGKNKRHARKAMLFVMESIEKDDMKIKRDWQFFPIAARGMTFLSYRFFNGYTLLTKPLMYRIARKMVRAEKRMSVHMAMGVVSYLGILKHCNSFNFKKDRVYTHINQKYCRRLISNASKNKLCRTPISV